MENQETESNDANGDEESAPTTDDGDGRLTFAQGCWAALGLGLLIFAKDWSGFNSREPDLFFPRAIREIWWHLPAAVGFSFFALQMVRLLDWTKGRPWPYWIAYLVVLMTMVFLGVWLVVLVVS